MKFITKVVFIAIYLSSICRFCYANTGSGSIAIACHNLGYDLTGYEIDTEYYEAAKKRLKEHQSQIRMF